MQPEMNADKWAEENMDTMLADEAWFEKHPQRLARARLATKRERKEFPPPPPDCALISIIIKREDTNDWAHFFAFTDQMEAVFKNDDGALAEYALEIIRTQKLGRMLIISDSSAEEMLARIKGRTA